MRNMSFAKPDANYERFLAGKFAAAPQVGFDVSEADLAIDDARFSLMDFQRDITRWACRVGRAAIFADCGLGKTPMQLHWARQVVQRTGKSVLILTPLAVGPQTHREGAERFGIASQVDREDRTPAIKAGIHITNYERLDLFEDSIRRGLFGGVVLDESSILKSFMGKTKRQLVELFADTPYRLCCTATPAPNDHTELGNHAEFLGIMSGGEMLGRWFINNSMSAGSYRLKGHAEGDFWKWVSSWAVCLSKPSDLGYSDEGYELPELVIRQHTLSADSCPAPKGMLMHTAGASATNIHKIGRATAAQRSDMAAKLTIEAMQDGPVLAWCNTNYEADAFNERFLTRLAGHDDLPRIIEVRGSDPYEQKERNLLAFTNGEVPVLLTKPSIAGYGVNWQHCNREIFCGLSFSYEDFYQALRRCWRFGQTRKVIVDVVTTDAEASVLEAIETKHAAHQKMKDGMQAALRECQIANIRDGGRLALKPLTETLTESGEDWTLHQGDCVLGMRGHVPDNSVGISVFSPPFSNLYTYSDSIADMGNTSGDDEFFEQFRFVIQELHRVTIPGRLAAVHCKDLPLYRGRDGAAGLRDFPGRIIREFESAGWTYHSRVTIWKCPVLEMTRTKSNGLLYKQLRKDSSASRQGMADYVLAFRKWQGIEPGEAGPDPVPHTKSEFPLEAWQKLASPVWDYSDAESAKMVADRCDLPTVQIWNDIQQPLVLGGFRAARGDKDEKHICPLQLDVIARCLLLWSKPGDLVLSPFAGIGSEGYVSVLGGRKFVGFELKPEYCQQARRYLRIAQAKRKAGERGLFDAGADELPTSNAELSTSNEEEERTPEDMRADAESPQERADREAAEDNIEERLSLKASRQSIADPADERFTPATGDWL